MLRHKYIHHGWSVRCWRVIPPTVLTLRWLLTVWTIIITWSSKQEKGHGCLVEPNSYIVIWVLAHSTNAISRVLMSVEGLTMIMSLYPYMYTQCLLFESTWCLVPFMWQVLLLLVRCWSLFTSLFWQLNIKLHGFSMMSQIGKMAVIMQCFSRALYILHES